MSKYEKLNINQIKTLINYIDNKDYDYAGSYLSVCVKSFSNTVEGDKYWTDYFIALMTADVEKINKLSARLQRDLCLEERETIYIDRTFKHKSPELCLIDISNSYLFKAQNAITDHLLNQLKEINEEKAQEVNQNQQTLSNLSIDGWN